MLAVFRFSPKLVLTPLQLVQVLSTMTGVPVKLMIYREEPSYPLRPLAVLVAIQFYPKHAFIQLQHVHPSPIQAGALANLTTHKEEQFKSVHHQVVMAVLQFFLKLAHILNQQTTAQTMTMMVMDKVAVLALIAMTTMQI